MNNELKLQQDKVDIAAMESEMAQAVTQRKAACTFRPVNQPTISQKQKKSTDHTTAPTPRIHPPPAKSVVLATKSKPAKEPVKGCDVDMSFSGDTVEA